MLLNRQINCIVKVNYPFFKINITEQQTRLVLLIAATTSVKCSFCCEIGCQQRNYAWRIENRFPNQLIHHPLPEYLLLGRLLPTIEWIMHNDKWTEHTYGLMFIDYLCKEHWLRGHTKFQGYLLKRRRGWGLLTLFQQNYDIICFVLKVLNLK